MGIFDGLFHRKPKNSKYADVLSGMTPVYSQFGTDIYASDVVQQALSCIVTEIKKLNPQHIRTVDSDIIPVKSDIQTVLKRPNQIMTTSDFIEKFMWLLLLNYNTFIVPTYYTWKDETGKTQKRYSGLYPIQPAQVDFIQDISDTLYVKFTFANGYDTTFPYSEVIHIRHRYSVNEFMGGNERGQPDNSALLKTLDLNHRLLQGVSKSIGAGYAVNGIAKIKSLLDREKIEKSIQEFNEMLARSESGFIVTDMATDVTPVQRDIKLVDNDTLKFIDEKILRNFGVPLCILTGDYTKPQYEAFYQKTLEPIIIAVSQAFTKALFTDRECSFGNEIKFYPKDLIFMDINQTLEMVRLLGDSGSLYENEKRVAFGLKPLPELEGVRMQSLNYVNIEYAKQYQTGGSDGEK